MKESTAVKVDGLKEFFKDKTIFTLDDLREYYRGIDSNFTETTFKWRIHDLKHKGLIGNVKRGATLTERPTANGNTLGRGRALYTSLNLFHFPNV